jgi:hypothetical protein
MTIFKNFFNENLQEHATGMEFEFIFKIIERHYQEVDH